MASNRPSHLPVAEPLCFHSTHGDQIRLSDSRTHAARDRLSSNLLFSNRPVLPNEIVHFSIEDVCNELHGLIRIGLTTIDPGSFTRETLPKSMPIKDAPEWFVPTLRGLPEAKRGALIRFKYTPEGNVRTGPIVARSARIQFDFHLALSGLRGYRLRQASDRCTDLQRRVVRCRPDRKHRQDSSRTA